MCCAPRLCCACISFCFYCISLESGIQRGREGAWNVERGGQERSRHRHRPIFQWTNLSSMQKLPRVHPGSLLPSHPWPRTDRLTDRAKMPRRFYTTVHVGVSFPFLSIFMSFHSIFSPYGPTIDSLSAPPICETEFAIVCQRSRLYAASDGAASFTKLTPFTRTSRCRAKFPAGTIRCNGSVEDEVDVCL